MYFKYVKQRYESLLIRDDGGKNVDKYYDRLKEPIMFEETYLQYPKKTIGMIKMDVEKTLMLMREAILAYYKVYHNKKLIAELTYGINNSGYMEFSIMEDQLLHLLGVTVEQLRNNPDFIRLTGKKHMRSPEILEWIIRDLEGNNDLIQYDEDFLKRISNNRFKLAEDQFDNDTQTRLLNYHKIRVKSHAFLKYGPFEKVSLVAKLNKKVTTYAKSNTVMISRAESFKKYPWAYFGSVQTPEKKYIETLLIDSDKGKKELLKGSTPAIVKGIESDSGNGSSESHIFSEEERFKLMDEAYKSFSDILDFTKLIEYFNQLDYEFGLGKTNDNSLSL